MFFFKIKAVVSEWCIQSKNAQQNELTIIVPHTSPYIQMFYT